MDKLFDKHTSSWFIYYFTQLISDASWEIFMLRRIFIRFSWIFISSQKWNDMQLFYPSLGESVRGWDASRIAQRWKIHLHFFFLTWFTIVGHVLDYIQAQSFDINITVPNSICDPLATLSIYWSIRSFICRIAHGISKRILNRHVTRSSEVIYGCFQDRFTRVTKFRMSQSWLLSVFWASPLSFQQILTYSFQNDY